MRKKIIHYTITIFLISIFTLPPLYSQETSSLTIGKISFQQIGAMKVPIDLIKYNLSIYKGQKFSQEELNRNIESLYKSGYFSDVRAEVKKEKGNIVNIKFILTNTPIIDKIIITGNKKYSSKELLEKIPLKAGEPLDPKLLRKSIKILEDFYHNNGYYSAVVYPSSKKLKSGKVILTITISENLRLRVNKVIFKGNRIFTSSELKDVIETRHSYFSWLFDWGLYNKEVVREDKIRLRNLYWTKGYLDFSVRTKVKRLQNDPIYVNVIFYIHEGKPYKVSTIDILGARRFTKKRLLSLISIKRGQMYNITEVDKSINRIRRLFYQKGYCDFSCEANLDTNYKKHTVKIIFKLREGRPYTIRNVNIKGNKITKDYVIRRELPIQPGQPVNIYLVDVGKSRLLAMNYFKSVKTYITNSNIPGEKNVTYAVKEKSTAHASIGGGFSTDNSLFGRLTLSESNFDLFSPSTFFRGGGQRLDLMAQVGLKQMDFALSFTEPWLFNIPLRLNTTGFIHTRRYEYWREKHLGFEVGLDKPFGEFNSIGIAYTLDFVDVSHMDDKYTSAEKSKFSGWERIGKLRLEIKRDTRDSLIMPKSGYLLSAVSEINSVGLGGSSNFYRWELGASNYYTFFYKIFTLHTSIKYGVVQGLGGDKVPIFERYFLGGQRSIRGFKYRRVSPYNSNGAPIGGKSMFIASVELAHPIYKWISGAPFIDIGNSWKNAYDFGSKLNIGIGYSIRVLIPQITNIPLKFDIGYPIYRADSRYSKSLQFYFDLGVDW